MVFSSVIFLFLFLPFTLFVNTCLRESLRNLFLLAMSLLFYAWGEGQLVLLMIFSILINYLTGIGIDRFRYSNTIKKSVLSLGIVFNIVLLIYYKYFNFLIENVKLFGLDSYDHSTIILPIGISFFTFQSVSYLIDLYREETEVQTNPFHLGLYISLFPQLIAGPIVRYHDIANQIVNRKLTQKKFVDGIMKFIRGLAKKVFVANTAALIADNIFSSQTNELPSVIAWIGILCYTLQIYFDFSGYSDMAIGLGRMLGFEFKENFNYPYISTSIQEFWRRWHISLSTWFRDYLYIPLGGSRGGPFKTYRNLLIVFLITGLWHGASWNFVLWGVFHGAFLMLERSGLIRINTAPKIVKHFYVIVVVIVGWVFFRIENFGEALNYLYQMFSFQSGTNWKPLLFLNYYTIIVLLLGIIFSTPLRLWLKNKFQLTENLYGHALRNTSYLLLFILTIVELAQSNYNPFIYFRF